MPIFIQAWQTVGLFAGDCCWLRLHHASRFEAVYLVLVGCQYMHIEYTALWLWSKVFLVSSRKHIFVACLKEVSKWRYDYLCREKSMKFVLVFGDPRWSMFVGTVIFSGSPMLKHGSCRWCLSRFTRIFNDPLQYTWDIHEELVFNDSKVWHEYAKPFRT